MKLFIRTLTVFLLFSGYQMKAQPLDFFDIRDSLHLTEVDAHQTADFGWLHVGLTADSALMFIKYDYCGDISYIKKFKIDTSTAVSDLHSTHTQINNADTIYIACVYNTPTGSGIYCLSLYAHKGDIQYPKLTSLPNNSLYYNPTLIGNDNDRLLVFNAGTDEKDLTGYVLKMDNLFQVNADFRFPDTTQIRGVLSLGQDGYMLTIGRNRLAKMFKTLQFDYVYTLDSNFTHFNRGIVPYGNNQLALAGDYDKDPNRSYYAVVHFDPASRKADAFNRLVAYNRSLRPRLIYYRHPEFFTNNIVVSFLYTTGANRSLLANSVFINKNYGNTQFLNTTMPYTALSVGLDYLPAENNFTMAGSFVDTFRYFSAKLNKNARLSDCFYFSSSDTVAISDFGIDTFSRTKVEPFALPNINSTVRYDTANFKLKRLCSYFDFKQGTTKLDYCNGVRDTVFVVSAVAMDPDSYKNQFVKYKWSTGATTQTIEVRYPYDPVTVEVTYCSEKRTFTYNFNAKDCTPLVQIANVFAPGSEIQDNKVFSPYLKEPGKVKLIEWKIYNRWGAEIFSANNVTTSWDGNYKGNPAPADTYTVQVIVTDIYNMTNKYSAMFTLVR